MNKKWHAFELYEIEKQLNTSLEGGLSVREARLRLENEKKRYGGERRSLFLPPKKSVVGTLLTFFKNPYMIILVILSLLSFILGNLICGILVFLAAVTGSIISGIVLLNAEKKQYAMFEYANPMIRVKRGGSILRTDGRNAVVGDIIVLSEGDVLPCDARLIFSDKLEVKELIHTKKGIRNRIVTKKHDCQKISDDINVPDAENMIYAGSIILKGEACAIVVETGENVYLAKYCKESLSGSNVGVGGVEPVLAGFYTKFLFISTAALSVLTLISMLTTRGDGFLQIFLTLLSSLSMLSLDVCKIVKNSVLSASLERMSRMSRKKCDTTAYIRDVKTLERLTDVTDLALLGDAAFSDGVLHLREVYTAAFGRFSSSEGIENARRLMMCVYAYIRSLDESGCKTDFVRDGVIDALFEALKNSKFDKKGADLILNSTYFAPDSSGMSGYACIETPESEYRVLLSFDSDVVSFCKYIRGAEDKHILMNGRYSHTLSEFEEEIKAQGGKCLYVISEVGGETIFEGALSLCEGYVENIDTTLANIEAMGIRAIALVSSLSPVCDKLFNGDVAYANEFKIEGFDITHNFGKYKAYVGFSNEEHAVLVDFMRQNGSVIAAYGVGNEHYGAMSHANVAISCDVVKYSSQKYKEAVYEKLPQEGRDTNIRCSQQTRLLSKVLVHRANQSGGGLLAIDEAFKKARGACLAFSNSLLYYTVIMSIILPIVAMTAITGISLLNSVQTACLTAAAVILAANVFAVAEPLRNVQSRCCSSSYYKFFKDNLAAIIVRSSVAFSFAITVKILDVFNVFGEKASYSMPVFISLITIMALELFGLGLSFTKRGAGRRRIWMRFFVGCAILGAVCVIITRDLFVTELFPNGVGTYEFILVPAYCILHVSTLLVFYIVKGRRNQN